MWCFLNNSEVFRFASFCTYTDTNTTVILHCLFSFFCCLLYLQILIFVTIGVVAERPGKIEIEELQNLILYKVELNREQTVYELYEQLHRLKGKPNEWLNEK